MISGPMPQASPMVSNSGLVGMRHCGPGRGIDNASCGPRRPDDHFRTATTPPMLRRLWLLFAQTVTIALALWFVVATLKPHWLPAVA